MHPLYDEFIKYLDAEDKEESVAFILSKLENGEIDIISLYSEILKPSLNVSFCVEGDESCIWKEHIRTSMIRTILESTYSYLVEEIKAKGIKKRNKKVVLACPSDEYHELGVRMVADFFTYVGFDAILIGANTPKEEILSAINYFKPDIVAISVTNYYHLVEVEKAIKLIKENNFSGKIVVGGNAFQNNSEISRKIGADVVLQTFDEIKKFVEEM